MPQKIEVEGLRLAGLTHGFFTRQGGISGGPYNSLNCGFGSGDETQNVAANRAEVLNLLGASQLELITPYQHHSADVIVAKTAWAPGEAPKGDAIVTTSSKFAIGILTADCAPVLFASQDGGVIGAAHAGWRGAIGGVLEATVATMARLGAEPSGIIAAIGPCLGQENFEVGSEFYEQFTAVNKDYARFFKRPVANAKPHFDLAGFCHARLLACDIGAVHMVPHCTYARESLYFSYRRNTHQKRADYGRQISAIALF